MAWPNAYGLDTSRFDSDPRPEPRKPVILIVHGAHLSSEHFDQLRQQFDGSGYLILVPQLPSAAFSHQDNVVEADVQKLVDACLSEMYDGSDIVFAMFGYGGVPGSLAAERLNHLSLDRPRAGQVTKLLFIDAAVLDVGESFIDILAFDSGDLEVTSNQKAVKAGAN